MKKEKKITKRKILQLLRENFSMLSTYPNAYRVLFFKRLEMVNGEPEEFDVQVRCQHKNYISLARDLYNADEYGTIKKGAFGNNDFSHISFLEVLIKQLEKDGYVTIQDQKCDFYSEFGKEIVPDGRGGLDEVYIDAKKYFSEEERKALETSITLTTKGQNWSDFWRDKINSEPLAVLSFVIASISLIISILK